MEITRQKSLEALLAITIGLAVAFYFTRQEYWLLACITLAIIGLLFPAVAKAIAWLWFRLAEIMGRINSFVLLSALFFLLLTPMAWLKRLFTKDTLGFRKRPRATGSYYVDRNHDYEAKDLENLW